MLPASNRGAGQSIGFPDVCLTPAAPAPVPIPYPNIGMNAQALGFSPVVKMSMVNALNLGSKIAMTMGDEAGSAHPTIKGAGSYTMGNPVVSIDKLPAINLTCPTTGNNMNNPVGAVLVPSATNVLLCRRAEAPVSEEVVGAALAARSVPQVHAEAGGVGVVRVASCASDVAAAVMDAALRLEATGTRAVVLDLRANPGGDLLATVALAGALLEDGATVARLPERGGDEVALRAHGPARCLLPLVLVVDGGTASAAELLALALQWHQRAVVVGAVTFGKGWAFSLGTALDGTAHVMERTAWRGPDGVSVEGVGLEPDLQVGDDGDPMVIALEIARELAAPA